MIQSIINWLARYTQYETKRTKPVDLFWDCIGRRLWLRCRFFEIGLKEGHLIPDRVWFK